MQCVLSILVPKTRTNAPNLSANFQNNKIYVRATKVAQIEYLLKITSV